MFQLSSENVMSLSFPAISTAFCEECGLVRWYSWAHIALIKHLLFEIPEQIRSKEINSSAKSIDPPQGSRLMCFSSTRNIMWRLSCVADWRKIPRRCLYSASCPDRVLFCIRRKLRVASKRNFSVRLSLFLLHIGANFNREKWNPTHLLRVVRFCQVQRLPWCYLLTVDRHAEREFRITASKRERSTQWIPLQANTFSLSAKSTKLWSTTYLLGGPRAG